jgi:hypothetical protein
LPETKDLLIKTVNINSGTLNIEGKSRPFTVQLEKLDLKANG